MSRRSVITGAGAGAAAMAVGVAGAPLADAAPKPVGPEGVADPSVVPAGSPVTTTIASSPVSGWVYRTKSMYSFRPFNPAAQVTFGGYGVYPAGVASALRAEFEIPAGARVREAEFYMSNSSAANITASVYLYAPGTSVINIIGSVSVTPNSGITASRVILSSDNYGPYPFGSSVFLSVTPPTDKTIQINGGRVGFSNGAGEVGLLDTPVRAYDSRSHDGPIHAGETRTVNLPPSVVARGVAGVIVNVTAVNALHPGYLKIYSTSGAVPAASAINFDAQAPIANSMELGVSNAGRVNIFASQTTDVILDITGTLS